MLNYLLVNVLIVLIKDVSFLCINLYSDDTILLVRKVGEEVIYRHWMNFDSIDEAKTYFEDEL